MTVARIFTNTLTGILPADVPAYLVAQVIGAACACAVFGWLFAEAKNKGMTSLSDEDKTDSRDSFTTEVPLVEREPVLSGYSSSRR